MMRTVTGELSKPLGRMNVLMEVDEVLGDLEFRVAEHIDHEMVLGMDFIRKWMLEVKAAESRWRNPDGEWHAFADTGDDEVKIVAECAGICEITADQEERVRRLVQKYLGQCTDKFRYTNLIRHKIDVQGAPAS